MMAKFGFMHKIFYNKVMSILNKIQQQSNTQASQSQERDAFSLSKQEIELLLSLIKESSFKGEHIETLYALVYKLQQQYLNNQ
jgi:hypothetical protein